MRQRELLDFRTPQHPQTGTNNWGGASPLLARSLPREALEQRYLMLNTIRECDQVFPPTTIDHVFKSQPITTASIGEEVFAFLRIDASKYEYATPRRGGKRRVWRWWKRKRGVTLGNPRFRSLPILDPKYKWPNGWC